MGEDTGKRLTFLQDATLEQLEEAAAYNHREMFIHGALSQGGEVREEEGISWTYEPKGGGTILFPRFNEGRADAQIDRIVAYYRECNPKHLVGLWSLCPFQPTDLSARVLARGFQPGWQPNWMALDLHAMVTEHPRPEELEVRPDDGIPLWEVPHLPYAPSKNAAPPSEESDGWRRKRYVALLDGTPVGHCATFITDGPLGVAGIYSMGVVPDAQNRGIGKAVLIATLQYALGRGCRYALLNGTGRRMYEQVGFRHIGYGQTWWLNVPRLNANPPTALQVRLAEAVGRGDLPALAALENEVGPDDLNRPMTNEMTLLQLAVHEGKPESADWLVSHGAAPDLLSFWDLGWKDRAAQLLKEQPELVNARSGDSQITLMHEAAVRNDIDLVRFLLNYRPDLTIEDSNYHSTPLGWAEHMGHTEIVELLRSAGG